MKAQLFAVFTRHGFDRATKRPVGTGAREIGVLIDVHIPDQAFADGYVHATIAVPEDAFTLPPVTAAIAAVEPMQETAK